MRLRAILSRLTLSLMMCGGASPPAQSAESCSRIPTGPLRRIQLPQKSIAASRFAANGSAVASVIELAHNTLRWERNSAATRNVLLTQLESGQNSWVVMPHSLSDFSLSGDGAFILGTTSVFVSDEGGQALVRLSDRKKIFEFKSTPQFNWDTSYFSGNGQCLLLKSDNGIVWVRDLKNETENTFHHDGSIDFIDISPDCHLAIGADRMNGATWADFSAGTEHVVNLERNQNIGAARITETGPLLAATDYFRENVRIYDVKLRKFTKISAFSGQDNQIELSPDGRVLFSWRSMGRRGSLIFLETGERRNIALPSEPVEKAEFSSDGNYLLVVTQRGRLTVVDIAQGGVWNPKYPGALRAVRISSDSQSLLLANSTGLVTRLGMKTLCEPTPMKFEVSQIKRGTIEKKLKDLKPQSLCERDFSEKAWKRYLKLLRKNGLTVEGAIRFLHRFQTEGAFNPEEDLDLLLGIIAADIDDTTLNGLLAGALEGISARNPALIDFLLSRYEKLSHLPAAIKPCVRGPANQQADWHRTLGAPWVEEFRSRVPKKEWRRPPLAYGLE